MKMRAWHLQRSVKGVGKVRGGTAVLCYERSADSETSITVRDCCARWHFVCCEWSKVGRCRLWFIGCCCCCCCFYGDPAEEWRSRSPLFECQQPRWRETAVPTELRTVCPRDDDGSSSLGAHSRVLRAPPHSKCVLWKWGLSPRILTDWSVPVFFHVGGDGRAAGF